MSADFFRLAMLCVIIYGNLDHSNRGELFHLRQGRLYMMLCKFEKDGVQYEENSTARFATLQRSQDPLVVHACYGSRLP